MTKSELRRTVLAQLKAQDKLEKALKDRQLIDQLTRSAIYQKAQTIATYLAFEHEVDTQLLIAQAQADGKRVLVPKTYGQGQMIFVAYDKEDLVPTKFGLLEPRSELAVPKSEIDFIHVPGVVFTNAGYRIGYGGGYYDRYLADYSGDTVSTAYSFQQRMFEPDAYDIAVQEVFYELE